MSDMMIICSLYGFYLVLKIYFYYQDFTNEESYRQFKGVIPKNFSQKYEIIDQRFYKWAYTYGLIMDLLFLIIFIYCILYQPTFDFFSKGMTVLMTISLAFGWNAWNKCMDKKIIKPKK